jgi:hypothetical protein
VISGETALNRKRSEMEFLINRDQILCALARLGELASAEGLVLSLGLVGGGVMVLEYGARESTQDLDCIFLQANQAQRALELARIVAAEHDLPDDWLNDDASIFFDELFDSYLIFQAPGVEVYAASTAQMLGLKLSAWRGPVDISDAVELLGRMTGSRDKVWRKIKPHVVLGCEDSAEDNFSKLWSVMYDQTITEEGDD